MRGQSATPLPLSYQHNGKGGELVAILYDIALVLWSALKIVVSNPILLILALISIGKRVVRN